MGSLPYSNNNHVIDKALSSLGTSSSSNPEGDGPTGLRRSARIAKSNGSLLDQKHLEEIQGKIKGLEIAQQAEKDAQLAISTLKRKRQVTFAPIPSPKRSVSSPSILNANSIRPQNALNSSLNENHFSDEDNRPGTVELNNAVSILPLYSYDGDSEPSELDSEEPFSRSHYRWHGVSQNHLRRNILSSYGKDEAVGPPDVPSPDKPLMNSPLERCSTTAPSSSVKSEVAIPPASLEPPTLPNSEHFTNNYAILNRGPFSFGGSSFLKECMIGADLQYGFPDLDDEILDECNNVAPISARRFSGALDLNCNTSPISVYLAQDAEDEDPADEHKNGPVIYDSNASTRSWDDHQSSADLDQNMFAHRCKYCNIINNNVDGCHAHLRSDKHSDTVNGMRNNYCSGCGTWSDQPMEIHLRSARHEKIMKRLNGQEPIPPAVPDQHALQMQSTLDEVKDELKDALRTIEECKAENYSANSNLQTETAVNHTHERVVINLQDKNDILTSKNVELKDRVAHLVKINDALGEAIRHNARIMPIEPPAEFFRRSEAQEDEDEEEDEEEDEGEDEDQDEQADAAEAGSPISAADRPRANRARAEPRFPAHGHIAAARAPYQAHPDRRCNRALELGMGMANAFMRGYLHLRPPPPVAGQRY
jgi:hypothetical protein